MKPVLILVLVVLTTVRALCQQTVFNVPSADVVSRSNVFLQHESQFRIWKPDPFWLGTHYAAVGIGINTEMDATLFNVSSPASNNVTLGVGFKTSFPILSRYPDHTFKVTFGQMLPISLQGQGIGSWTYSHFSGRLGSAQTRLTAGVSAGTKQIFGRSVVAFIGAVEHPLTPRFSAIGDWYSGTHSNGFLIPGVSYSLGGGTIAYLGMQIPNHRINGRSGLVFEIAWSNQ